MMPFERSSCELAKMAFAVAVVKRVEMADVPPHTDATRWHTIDRPGCFDYGAAACIQKRRRILSRQ